MNVKSFLSRWILVSLVFMSRPTWGRFHHEDSLEIDPVENITPEYYNDLLSYKEPASFRSLWSESANGFKTSAGSLDIRRFSFTQDLKLSTAPSADLVLSFKRERQETFIAQKAQEEVRVTQKFYKDSSWNFEASLLGDCGLEKEYGDIGLEFGAAFARKLFVTYRYWDVDLYYNSKKEAGEDTRSKNTLSHEGAVYWVTPSAGTLGLEGLLDTPLDWIKRSDGYRYQFQEQSWKILWTALTDTHSNKINFSFLQQQKSEGVSLLGLTPTEAPSMRPFGGRPTRLFPPYLRGSGLFHSGREGLAADQKVTKNVAEVTVEHSLAGADHLSGGLLYVQEKTSRTLSGLDPSQVDQATGQSPEAGRIFKYLAHHEGALYGFYSIQDRKEERYIWHHGAVVNHQKNNHLFNRDSYEAKYVAAIEIKISKGGRFYLNSTWDIDQLLEDAPFTKRPFRPWGGGNLQGLIVF